MVNFCGIFITQLVSGGLKQKPGLLARSHLWWLMAGRPGSRQGCWSFRGFQNFKRRYLSSYTCQSISDSRFEHLARQASKFRKYTSWHGGNSCTVHNYYIIIQFHYSIRISSKSPRILAKSCLFWPPTSIQICLLYAKVCLYEPPLIRSSSYTNIRSTLWPLVS
jgi:hypothetical protein